jgi:hypothetical protein
MRRIRLRIVLFLTTSREFGMGIRQNVYSAAAVAACRHFTFLLSKCFPSFFFLESTRDKFNTCFGTARFCAVVDTSHVFGLRRRFPSSVKTLLRADGGVI